ncbi:MAG: GntR family transcriptional regulator [Stappiaceae bacterium]
MDNDATSKRQSLSGPEQRQASDLPNDGSRSESMTSRVYSQLRDDIITGKLMPGQKLKIEELRRLYDVGTSPIREALSLLTSDHFVERIDQRGFRVTRASAEEFAELLKTRCWLEERALRESIQHGSSNWEEQVILATYRLSRVPRSESPDNFVAIEEWEKRHKIYHMTLLSACGSSILLKYCDQLYDQNVRYRLLAGSTAYPKRDVNAEHGEISDAILARDEELAVKLLVSHYTNTGKFLQECLGD